MLTAEQFEAIGRLTIAFNEIEHLLDMYLPDILGNPEPSVAFLIAEAQSSVSRKIEFLKKLLEEISRDRPAAQSEITTVVGLLDKAKELSGRRNDYVHAFAFVDFKAKKRNLRTKKGVIECNANEILAVANEMDLFTVPLSQALHDLKTVLIKLRYA
jgi:hypothetical protein